MLWFFLIQNESSTMVFYKGLRGILCLCKRKKNCSIYFSPFSFFCDSVCALCVFVNNIAIYTHIKKSKYKLQFFIKKVRLCWGTVWMKNTIEKEHFYVYCSAAAWGEYYGAIQSKVYYRRSSRSYLQSILLDVNINWKKIKEKLLKTVRINKIMVRFCISRFSIFGLLSETFERT